MSLSQLSQLLPLPEEELQQVLDYATTLSKPEAVSHFSNLLGDSPLAIDFISSFNSRRKDPSSAPASSPAPGQSASTETPAPVPKTKRGGNQNKKKKAIHTPPPRQINDYSNAAGGGTAYSKKDNVLDYIPQHQRASAPTSQHVSRAATPTNKPAAAPAPQKEKEQRPSSGYLISDLPASKAKSNPTSRTSTPKPPAGGPGATTKISISGGTPMAGQSTALADLDAAIRALEITTNPSLNADPKRRRCNCVATRHPLQTAAPNCISCGKVICMKEGLGPCTFCGTPLLSSNDVQAMVKELKGERGRELMAADAKANRRAEVSKKPAPFSQNRAGGAAGSSSADPTLAQAQAQAMAHRDKLLGYQAQNAKRTTVRDEAADFDVGSAMSGSGGSMWASPEERARELKRQQKLVREMEWNARPEYEKRQQVLSIDLVGGKVIRRMAAVERPATPESEEEEAEEEDTVQPDGKRRALAETAGNRGTGGGAFSGNPLLGSLIKPVFEVKGKGPELEGRESKKTSWRRVQNDMDDNEDIILDGGVYGHKAQ